MRGCGGVNPVDGVADGVQRGIESERDLGSERSLSMVLGTPTIFIPFCESS